MNINEELLKEKVFTKEQAFKVMRYAGASKQNFKALMQCFLSDKYRLAQRASSSVSMVVNVDPSFIKPYIKDLIIQLSRTDIHDAVKRNSIRILQQIDVPHSLHGDLMNSCFQLIELHETPVAIKAFSLTTLYDLTKFYPDITNELKVLIEDRWDHESAAFRARAKTILKQIEKS